MKIMLDPGHGGNNRGAERAGIVEKDWTLEFCLGLRRPLEACGFEVLMTRSFDQDLSLEQRGSLSQGAVADLVLIVHLNAFEQNGKPDTTMSGLMAFVLPDDPVAGHVGSTIMRCAPEVLKRSTARALVCAPDNWTRRAYNCLRHHAGRNPVLVEVGFLTCPQDVEALMGAKSRPALTAAILAGAGRAMELLDGTCG